MRINIISPTTPNVAHASMARRAEAAGFRAVLANETQQSTAKSLTTELLARHDLADISRFELRQLADDLHEAGILTGEQRLDLTAPYVDVLDVNMESVMDVHQRRNFVGDVQAALDDVRRSRPHDALSIAHFEKVKHLADALAAMTARAREERV